MSKRSRKKIEITDADSDVELDGQSSPTLDADESSVGETLDSKRETDEQDESPSDRDPNSDGGELGLEQENEQLRDLLQRKQAEFENYRKRMDRERTDIVRYAGAEVVREVLPVLDNLERAIDAYDTGSDEQLREGVSIIYRQFKDILLKQGLAEVEAEQRPFDPHVHEAVSRVESSDHAEGVVVDVFQKGYRFKDRLLRPAMVSVALGSESENKTETETTNESSRSASGEDVDEIVHREE